MKILDKELFPRKVAIVIFYDRHFHLLVQKRENHSKVGEKYGFFGGGIKKGETAEQALRRELVEELNYKPKILRYWGRYSFVINLPNSRFNNEIRYGELFLSPVTQELMAVNTEDDSEKTLLPIDRVLENRNYEFGPVKFNDAAKIKESLIELVKT